MRPSGEALQSRPDKWGNATNKPVARHKYIGTDRSTYWHKKFLPAIFGVSPASYRRHALEAELKGKLSDSWIDRRAADNAESR